MLVGWASQYFGLYMLLAIIFAAAVMSRTAPKTSSFDITAADIVAIAQDTRVYLSRERPSRNGRPLGSQPRRQFLSAGPKALPSADVVKRRLTASIIDDGDPGDQPTMDAVIQTALMCEPPLRGKTYLRDIPISPANHDNIQLEWGRKGVPLCCMGQKSCVAALLEGSLGALHIYLTVAEEREHRKAPMKNFGENRLCILCTRQQAALVKMSSSMAGALDIATYVPPPFKNIFNCHEGYKDKYVGALIPTADGDARICGISDEMHVSYRVDGKGEATWFIDQSSMLYGRPLT